MLKGFDNLLYTFLKNVANANPTFQKYTHVSLQQ